MKLLARWIILLAVMSLLSCSKETPITQDPDNLPEIDSSETIGSSGGQLFLNGLYLGIPQGAFDSENDIEISSAPGESAFGENLVSRWYHIQGTPAEYYKPLEIKIKHNGLLQDESFIAVSEQVLPSSIGELTRAYHLLDSRDSAGWLAASLPAPENLKKAAGLQPVSMNKTDFSGQLVAAVSSYATLYSSEAHFMVYYPTLLVSDKDAADLGEYLEQAYDTFKDGLGFSYSNRSIWPIIAIVKPFPFNSDAFGYYTNSLLGNNFGWMEFNRTLLSNKEQLKVTAGHEFFHFVQSLYDNRNPYSKAKLEPENLWLNEASAVWSEKLFSDNEKYASEIAQPFQMAPFNGLHAGASSGAQGHGYGMSVLFNYLTDKYGDAILEDIYQSMYKGVHTVEAIAQATEEPVNWLEDFFRQYVMLNLNVYQVGGSYWRMNMHDTYVIDDVNDIGITFSDSYPNLSARLYKIDITDHEIDENDKLEFSLAVDEGVSEITVLKYRVGDIEFVANSSRKVTVDNIKEEYMDKGWNLFALVTNSHAVPPYTGESFVDLKVDVIRGQDPPDYNQCSFMVRVLGHYHAETPDNSYDYDSDGTIDSWESYPGSFTENTFTGNYFREYPTYYISGSITVALNERHDTIVSVEWTEETVSPNFSTINTCMATNIPYAWGDIYQVEGEKACDHITSLSADQTAPDGLNYSMNSFECEWDSKVWIGFSKN